MTEYLTIATRETAENTVRFWVDNCAYYANRLMFMDEFNTIREAIHEGYCPFVA